MAMLQAKTDKGIVQGVLSNKGYALFRGVPYAKPPVGDLRWKPPVETDSWEGVRICDTYGPACMQFDRWATADGIQLDDSGHPYTYIENYPYPPELSEDCLYLNIYTPAESKDDKLPVCFFIHGGGLQNWYGSDYEYCGDQFCDEGCIVVTINYRLNVFGYFAHPDLDKESEHNTSGNYGFLDQVQALKWVYENIECFGGDKDKIMVFGQSAGGFSTVELLMSPLSNKYINCISVESCGGLTSLMKEESREEIFRKAEKLMEACGCKSIEEMRKLDGRILVNKCSELFDMFHSFSLNLDHYSIVEKSEYLMRTGNFKNVPIIMGCTADEGGNTKPPFFGCDMCSSINAFGKQQILNRKRPIYSYVFARTQPGDDIGVSHSADNRYLFGSLDGCWRPFTEEDYALSRKMTRYWANFAKTGNPNSEGLEEWTPYTIESMKQLKLDVGELKMHNFDEYTNGRISIESDRILRNADK